MPDRLEAAAKTTVPDMRGAQLPLAVARATRTDFAHFITGANGDAVAAVRAARDAIYLCGPPGSGKSHLLRAAARTQPGGVLIAAESPPDTLATLLDGAERVVWLGIDDIGRLAASHANAVLLARVLDRRMADGAATLVADDRGPAELEVLPDLATRLARMALYRLQALDDDTLRVWLQQAAARRGLTLADPAADWLMQFLPRSPGAMEAALHRLDTAALAAKRSQLSLPFVRSVLGVRATPAPAQDA